jgi:hypothetical protein
MNDLPNRVDSETTQWQKVNLSGEGGQTIYLEVLDRGGRREVGVIDSIPFDQVTQIFSELSQRIGEGLKKSMANKACVEIGMEFAIENGHLVGLIARATGKANFKVSIEWNPLDFDAKSPE